ncbi:ParB/RepB/Spo0J family partition protein [Lapidilactobacillus gannanensis]|jgi:ParB family chromosome partitioning protein|uniref:ParB/RepB/Spo0J family partition protein n=1 Tax=Lapidilactobacillus gannanensis TaxID=2486002 RepID=A0ABW4BM34_9LACO|nr:ParB/RepB/Spo0J family partition protein [Lapidilactobacillus gannanensis]MCH4056870.1 ParB/RepB/Spo0J family partition protein [Lactobacillaceae bacterium]
MATNKNSKGLGRGIDAIFSDYDALSTDKEAVEELPLDEIRPNPYQPRKTFDEEALQELANSIKQSGVFQPIILRKSINGYEIIAGERRFRASKIAGKQTIPAIVRQIDETQMMEIAVLENLQREDLTPLEEAEAYQTLIKKLALTQEEVSERIGKSRPYIANYLRLLTLPEQTKKYLQAGQLSMGQARTLLSLKHKEQIDQVAKKALADNLTVRQLEQLVLQLNTDKPKAAKQRQPKSPFIVATENALVDQLGTKVKIDSNKKGAGKIEINYASTDDLNRILEMMHLHLD